MKRTALCLLLLTAVCAVAQKSQPKAKPATEKPYTCVAGPDEVCASDLWVKDYDNYIALVKKYAPPQEVQDMLRGMRERLSESIPQGYKWDEAKRRYVKLTPTPAPAPAPAEKK